MNNKPLRWLAFGPGAISGLISAGLLRQQHSLAFVSRGPESAKTIAWALNDSIGMQHFCTPTYQQQWQPDAIVMAVKSYDVANALGRLDELGVSKHCPVILSHNGCVEHHSQRPLFAMITTQAASRCGLQIKHTGNGHSWLSCYAEHGAEPLPPAIQQAMTKSFAPLEVVQDINPRRWYKLLINCIINPLTAIYRVPNGALAGAEYQSIKAALIDEFLAVAIAAGYPFSATDAQHAVNQVILDTANNRSSMLADVEHGRPTEIEALNGYLVTQAIKLGINVPNHRWVLSQIPDSQASTQ